MNVYQSGNTVRLKCTFFDFDGNKVDPDMVKITVYDYKYNILFRGDVTKVDVGQYYYDYTTDTKPQTLYYEWYGEIYGKPSLKRGNFKTAFI